MAARRRPRTNPGRQVRPRAPGKCRIFVILGYLDDWSGIIKYYYHCDDKKLDVLQTEDAWLFRRPVLAGPEGTAVCGAERDSGHAVVGLLDGVTNEPRDQLQF